MGNDDVMRCVFLDAKTIRKEAESFRDIYWPEKTIPVDMEKIIEQRMELDIVPERISTLDAFLKGNRSGIVVNESQYMDSADRYANRLRFSFAHEIGHYILHERLYRKQYYENEHEYAAFIQSFPEEDYKQFEFQANEFAGCLLVPQERLIEEIESLVGYIIKEKRLGEYLDRYPHEVLSRISGRLSKPFGVSDSVIEIRVERERLWPPR